MNIPDTTINPNDSPELKKIKALFSDPRIADLIKPAVELEVNEQLRNSPIK